MRLFSLCSIRAVVETPDGRRGRPSALGKHGHERHVMLLPLPQIGDNDVNAALAQHNAVAHIGPQPSCT